MVTYAVNTRYIMLYQIPTFKYTNAVPQYVSHNRRIWKSFEGIIADYVKTYCGLKGGNMHPITGTLNYLRDSKTGHQVTAKVKELLVKMTYD